MRKRIALSVLSLLIFFGATYAQSTVRGNVTDENKNPVSFAAVTLLQPGDSTIVAYGTTDTDGKYTINHKSGNYILQASCLGFVPFSKNVSLSENGSSVVDFVLKESLFKLDAVVVSARNPGVKFNQDTIRYDLKVFTDGSEVVLGDVLNKLPGVEVNEKGGVKAQGKNVENILLNGQDIFSGNTQMATKNLPADIAENVEVLNNYSEYSLLKGFQSNEKTVINIGVNQERLGKLSGTVSAAGGHKEKYLGKANIMLLNSKLMTSFIGAVNNTGKEVFSIEDYIGLQGGISELGESDAGRTSINLSKEEQQLLLPNNNVFSRTNGLSALNMAYQPNQKLKINSYFLFNRLNEKSEDLIKYQYTLPENSFETSTLSKSKNQNNLYSGLLKLNYEPAASLSLTYKGTVSAIDLRRNGHSQNTIEDRTINSQGLNKAQTVNTKHDLLLLKTMGKHLLTSHIYFSYSDRPSTYNMQTDSLLLPIPFNSVNDWYYGQQKTTTTQTDLRITNSFAYRINPSYFLRASLNATWTDENYESAIFDLSPHSEAIKINDEGYFNDINASLYDYNTGINLVKNTGLFRFKLGVFAHLYQFRGDILKEHSKTRLNPQAEVSLHFSSKNILTVFFSESDLPISADAFASGMVFNSFQSYYHDSQVKRRYSTQYSTKLHYQFFELYSNTMIILTGTYNRYENTNTSNFNQKGLLTEYQPTTSDPHELLLAKLYVSKGLGNIPLTAKLTGGYNRNSFSNQSMGVKNNIRSENIDGQLQLTSNYRKWVDFECLAGMELSKNKSSLGAEIKQTTQRYAGKIKLNGIKGFLAYIGLEWIVNDTPEYQQHFYNLSAGLRYQLNKNIEFEITGENMLHLNEQDWVATSYNGVYMTERYFRQIPGNIMAKINCKF